ncbi:MAG: hypothetical protein ACKVS9_05835 [Phycisphaerae bacterium]
MSRNFVVSRNVRTAALVVTAAAMGIIAGCPPPPEPLPEEKTWDLGDVLWTQLGGEQPPYTLGVDSEFRSGVVNDATSSVLSNLPARPPVTSGDIADGTVTSADLDPAAVNNISNTVIQQLINSGTIDGSAIREATLRASAFVANMFSTLPVEQGGLPDGSIHGSKLINGTVTPEKLSFVIATNAIAAGAGLALTSSNNVSTLSIAIGGITSAMLADDAIDAIAARVAGRFPPGSVPGSTLTPGSVGATEIGDGAVGTSELADGSVTAPKLFATLFSDGVAPQQLAAGAIHGSKLTAGTVSGDRLVNATVTSGQINMADLIAALQASALFGGIPGGSIPPSAIGPGITGAQIADGTLTGADVQDGSLTGADIQDGSLSGADITDGSIGSADLAANSVTATQIADNAVGVSELADNSVDSAAIINGQVTTVDLADNAVTSGKIADGTIAEGDLSQPVRDRLLPPGVPFGDITAVNTPADSGLLGGATSGDVTMRVNPALNLGQSPTGPGASIHLFNGLSPNRETITLNADGGAFDAPEFGIANLDGSTGIYMRAQGTAQAPGALVRLFNGAPTNVETMTLSSAGTSGEHQGARVDLRDDGSILRAALSAGATNLQASARLSLSNALPNPWTTVRLYGNADPSGDGAIVLYSPNDAWGARLRTFDGVGNLDLFRPDGTKIVDIGGESTGGGVLRLRNADLDGPGPLTVEETITLAATSTGSNAGGRISVANGNSPNSATIGLEGNGPFGGGYLRLNGADGGRRGEFWAGAGANVPYSSMRLFDAADNLRLNFEAGHASNDVGGSFSAYNASGRVTVACEAGRTDGGAMLRMYNGQLPNQETITLTANEGTGPSLILRNPNGNTNAVLASNNEVGGRIDLRNENGATLIRLQAHSDTGDGRALICCDGEIRAGNGGFTNGGCDLAETFEHSDRLAVIPGMVMSIDPEDPGKLTVCSQAYDKRVAGIISGAGDLKPGVKLGQRADGSDDNPLALAGRVYCYVDATEQAVEVGDMLTTSDTPGYAMRAADPSRAFGCVLGKAMQPLPKGEKGLVLVLVSLQ